LFLPSCFSFTSNSYRSDFLANTGLKFSTRKGQTQTQLPYSVYAAYDSLFRPLKGGRITSHYGKRWGRFHEGVDFGASFGTPIYAAHDGKVIFAGSGLNGYGLMVVIKGNGIFTVYAHAQELYVETGDSVRAKEAIAEVGDTGHASGPHLHFEVRVNLGGGELFAVNPAPYFKVN